MAVLAELLGEAGFEKLRESRGRKPCDFVPVAIRLRPDEEILSSCSISSISEKWSR